MNTPELRHLAISTNGLPANCCNIFCNSREFLISKLPHSVFSPPAARSSESWLRIVVFPEPVGPVMTVSSPRLRPLTILVNRGNDCKTVPLYSSGFWKHNTIRGLNDRSVSTPRRETLERKLPSSFYELFAGFGGPSAFVGARNQRVW